MIATLHQDDCGIPAVEPPDQSSATNAAHLLGKRGGRPKGSCSSPLAMWLRSEIAQRQNEEYRCREAFNILRDTEMPDGFDAFELTDYTSDQHDVEPNARVTWRYFREIWRISRPRKAVSLA